MTSRTINRPPAARTRAAGWVALATAVVAALGITWWVRSGGDARAKAPYQDSAATGRLGLCDAKGRPVTSGSIKAAPFTWRAVGATAAPAAYAGAGRTATLYAFQPRPGAEPGSWSGRALTAPSSYSNPAHPMAAATKRDVPLSDFLAGYPARDSGYLQLRLYLGAPDRPEANRTYDALDIHVTGSTWHAVGAAAVDCHSGTAVSFETQVGSA
jgi:hypothetical protein